MAMNDRSTLSSGTMNWVRKHYHELRHLPEPGSVWLGSDVPYEPNRIGKFRVEGVIKRIKTGQRDANYCHYYETNRDAYEAVQEYLESYEYDDRLLPCSDPKCPGKGFTNLGENDDGAVELECNDCGEVHRKEDVK